MIYGRVNRCSVGPGTRSPREDRAAEEEEEERPSLSGSSLPRATGFAYSPNPVADIHHASDARRWVVAQVQREYIPLGEGLTADPVAAAGSCGWLVVHVCAG